MCCKIDKAAFLTLTARHSPLKERFQKIAADWARVVLSNSAETKRLKGSWAWR